MCYHVLWHIQEIEKAYKHGDAAMIITELKSMAYNTVEYDDMIKSLIGSVYEYSKGEIDKEDFDGIWDDEFIHGLKGAVENDIENNSNEPNWVGGECDMPIVL